MVKAGTAELVVVDGPHQGASVQLNAKPVLIGRGRSVELCLDEDSKVSHKHARVFEVEGERWLLEDLGSTNGTFINEERIDQSPLRSGDLIKIGRSLLVFRTDSLDVKLSDLRVTGGGLVSQIQVSSAAIAAKPSLPRAKDLPAVEAAIGDLVLAVADEDRDQARARALDVVQARTRAARTLLFMARPFSGGLACEDVRLGNDSEASAPVSADVLTRAGQGEVVAIAGVVAAPVRGQTHTLGVLCAEGIPPKRAANAVRILTAAGLLLGQAFESERRRRVAEAATSIVELAQAPAERVPVPLGELVQSLERLFRKPAEHQGLQWHARAQEAPPALADPALLRRGLDALLRHLLRTASAVIQVGVLPPTPDAPAHVTLELTRDRLESPERTAQLLDPTGLAADLRRALNDLDDGTLPVARAALLRAGAHFSVTPDGPNVRYRIRLDTSA